MDTRFDRSAQDIGNIVAVEHVNTQVPDHRLATIFYVLGLGLTRDPYLSVGVDNMWINAGRSQFHLPIGEPQILRGHVALVLPDRAELLARLTRVKATLDGTEFSYIEGDVCVEVISPWGNRFYCFEPGPSFGRTNLGIVGIEFDVPVGSAAPIARFYDEVFGTRTATAEERGGAVATCSVGNHQEFRFRETDRPLPEYDGHHLQIYVADFSTPHRNLEAHGLVIEESSAWQYRFKDIVDLDSGAVQFTIEHEVRSMTHPLYGRPFVNRDPNLDGNNFAGHESWAWTSLPTG